jgi:hypothetical protein
VSTPRKHHLVPQTYQRGFARKKGKTFQVRILNRATGGGGIRNVRDAFSQRDWNTIKTEDGLKEFGVERVLAEHIDAEATPALEATRRHEFPLSRTDREALAMFMAAQLSRARSEKDSPSRSSRSTGYCFVRRPPTTPTSDYARSSAESRRPNSAR